MGIRLAILLTLGLFASTGCGVRQYNSELDESLGGHTRVVIPKDQTVIHSSSHGPGTLNSNQATCHRCYRMKASVGVPYQFDQNTKQGYVTQAGAGKTMVSSGPRAPNFIRLENKDLSMMGRR